MEDADKQEVALEPVQDSLATPRNDKPKPIELLPSASILARAEALQRLLESPELDCLETDLQRRWIVHYFTDGRRQSARTDELAGYSGNSRNLERFRELVERIEVTLQGVDVANPKEVLALTSQIARDPQETGLTRLKALELMGKFHKMLSEKLTLAGSVNWKHSVQAMLNVPVVEAEVIKPK